MRSGMWALSIGVLALALTAPAQLLATTADDLCASSANPCVVATPVVVTDGSVIDVLNRELRIASGGALDVGAGTMTLRAATLTIQSGGFVRGLGAVSTGGGTVNVTADVVTIAGTLDVSGAPAGNLDITANTTFTATGSITARALSRDELGGTIQITAGSVAISGPVSVAGGFDSIGGDLGVAATGNVTISSLLDVAGGDGGGIEIDAGSMTSGGNITFSDTALLRADATTAGGFGGSIDVTALGDALTTGLVTVNGQLSAKGLTGTEEIGGGSGGCVDVSASGDIHVDRSSARLTAEGGAPDGDGGEVAFTSDNGGVVLEGTATAACAGPESNGGSVTIDAAENVVVNGSMLVTGGDGGGGEATIGSANASVAVGRSALIDVSSTSAGQGGEISIDSGIGCLGSHAVLVEGRLDADGGTSGGSGGSIDVSGGESVRIASTGSMRAAGTMGGGSGGTVSVTAATGTTAIEAPIVISGGSPNGPGGIVSLESAGLLSLTAPNDASGFGLGGQIGFATDTGPVEILADIDARSSTAAGGMIEVKGSGDVRVGGALQTDGAVAPGGQILITGCDVTICGLNAPDCPDGVTAVLSSAGPGGVNRITGHNSTAILGTVRARPSDGLNEFVFHEGAEPLVRGQVTPQPLLTPDNTIQECPACGDHVVESPETCDDGNQTDGDGCSASCQMEEAIPGDANGDAMVTMADVNAIITEIFDGDADACNAVRGGTLLSSAGADANIDERVTAPDITAVLKLLRP